MADVREYLCLEKREGKAKGDESPNVKYKSRNILVITAEKIENQA